jgi:hypothetical protein
MPRPIRFKRQYKPIGFGDPYDPSSVEGHRNAVRDVVENRRADRELKEIKGRREAGYPLFAKLLDRIRTAFSRRK